MAFETSLEDVESHCASTGSAAEGCSMLDIIRFGISKGYLVGAVFVAPKIYFGKIIQPYDIKGAPALAIVKSRYHEGETHAIYWNGQKVLDPDPGVEDGGEIKEYEIVGWYPVMKVQV